MKCYSVRLKTLVQITSKCLKATDFSGKTALIPISQFYGTDDEVGKSEAYWIAAWIIEKSGLQFSKKKTRAFDRYGEMLPSVTIEHHIPEMITPSHTDADESLIR